MLNSKHFLNHYWQDSGWLHRVPAFAKIAGITLLSALAMLWRDPLLIGTLLLIVVALGRSSRLPFREMFRPVQQILPMLIFFGIAQLVFNDWQQLLALLSVILLCVVSAAVLTLTTTVSELLTVFTVLCRPLRLLRVQPEHSALTAALVIMALSHLVDLAASAKATATSRGLQHSIRARTVPVILGAILHAEQLAQALKARDLV